VAKSYWQNPIWRPFIINKKCPAYFSPLLVFAGQYLKLEFFETNVGKNMENLVYKLKFKGKWKEN
jgi:hypothetical protein